MALSINKNLVSRGALGGAVVLGPACAFIGISNITFSEFGLYACLGLFLFLVLVHLFTRDGNFNKLQAVDKIIWIILPWFAILFFYAFMLGAYLAMFISSGFLILIYLLHLLVSFIKLEIQDMN